MIENYSKFLLAIGFILASISALLAHKTPARGYELSIYSATPSIVWLLLLTSLSISIIYSIRSKEAKLRGIGALLGCICFCILLTLPLIRGYYFYGTGDALSHLGRTQELSVGILSYFERTFPYPGLFVLIEIISIMTTISFREIFLLMPAFFGIAFAIFISLIVRLIEKTTAAAVIGLYSGFLLLPVNHITVHYQFQPSNLAIFFLPVILFLILKFINDFQSKTSILAVIASLALVLFHPLHGVSLVGISISIMSVLYILEYSTKFSKISPRVLFLTAVIGIFVWLWVYDTAAFRANIYNIFISITEGGNPGQHVTRASSLLDETNVTLGEIFMKLFSVSLIYCFLTLLLLLLISHQIYSRSQYKKTLIQEKNVLILSAALAPLFILFVIYFSTGFSNLHFRLFGLAMIITTILGAISLHRFMQSTYYKTVGLSNIIICFTFMIFLISSILIIYPSPYIIQPNQHVSEGQMSGFETTFKYTAEETELVSIHTTIFRHREAILGPKTSQQGIETQPLVEVIDWDETPGNYYSRVPNHFANQSLETYYSSNKYLIVTTHDQKRNLEMLHGLRFNEEDFQYIETDENISKIHSNGEFELQYIKTIS